MRISSKSCCYFHLIPNDVCYMILEYLAVRYCRTCEKHFYELRAFYENTFGRRYVQGHCWTCPFKTNDTPKTMTLDDLYKRFYPILEREVWGKYEVNISPHIVFPRRTIDDEGSAFKLCYMHKLMYSDYCRDCVKNKKK